MRYPAKYVSHLRQADSDFDVEQFVKRIFELYATAELIAENALANRLQVAKQLKFENPAMSIERRMAEVGPRRQIKLPISDSTSLNVLVDRAGVTVSSDLVVDELEETKLFELFGEFPVRPKLIQ